jgi:hypothetical protein
MPTQGGDDVDDVRALLDAIDEALAELPGEDAEAPQEPVDRRWLGIGLRLGLERPERARQLLGLIGTREAGADLATPAAAPAGEAGGLSGAGRPLDGGTLEPGPIPVCSSLLARAAAMPVTERTRVGPEVTFGWAARLTPLEIRSLGHVVGEMLAAGARPDIGRGFGLAWSDGVRLPREELDAMFREFTELEITVGGVLAGRDLRAGDPAPPRRGLSALLNPLLARRLPGQAEAGAAVESSGEAGRRGLVALWNAWVAMQYRARIPAPTFQLLVTPWVTVVGPLPEP